MKLLMVIASLLLVPSWARADNDSESAEAAVMGTSDAAPAQVDPAPALAEASAVVAEPALAPPAPAVAEMGPAVPTERATSSLALNPTSLDGQKVVHRLASRAGEAFVAQESAQPGSSGCDSAKEDLLHDLSLLQINRSADLATAKRALEKGSCQNALFAATLSLRAADHLN